MKDYNIDTKERKEKFEERRSKNWEDEFRNYRYEWDARPQRMDEGEYPLDILIEPIWACNLRCSMCPRNNKNHNDNRRGKIFDFDLYKKVIDEVGGKVPSIRLAGLGEATLNPQFVDYVKYAKEGGIGEVSLVTNSGLIDRDYFIRITQAGLDWISISIDGINEDYERVRYPLKYNDTIKRLQMMKEVRDELHTHKPAIQVQGLWKIAKGYADIYYNEIAPLCDYVQMQSYIDIDKEYGNWDDERYCSDVYRRLYINVDGDVFPCCNFNNDNYYKNAVLGNIKTSSIYEIWHGKKLSNLRKMQKEGKMHQGYCSSCCALRKLHEVDKVLINGREVTVREYWE